MKFEIKNLGIVKEANIEFKGLTILAGHNNIGKSFITRIIYSIIRTINQYEEQYSIERSDRLNEIFRLVEFRSRRLPLSEKNEGELFPKIEESLSKFRSIIVSLINMNPLFDYEKMKEKLDELNHYLLFLKGYNNFNDILKSFEELKLMFNEDTNSERKLCTSLNRYLSNEFQNQLNNGKEIFEISCNDDNVNIFNIKIENDITKIFKINNAFQYIDSTLIETPIILHLSRFLRNFAIRQFTRFSNKRNFTRYSDLAIHIPDLIEKLSEVHIPTVEKIINFDMNKIIDGKFEYDIKEDNFFYERKGKKIKPINMASGVKAFGILDILINNGTINSNSLLIIDEPEVHLHPEWQINYAEVICSLVKNNIPIIISSHSPYMIKGIEAFKNKYSINDKIKYYIGDEIDGFTYFKDVTDNIEPIYEKLSIPFMRLDLKR